MKKGRTAEFCRFDVISVLADDVEQLRIEHLKDAF